MKIYMAPMEGLTGVVFRQTYHKYFHNIDRYFTPFLSNKKLSSKEKNDILPENNQGMELIPQILTNRAEDFVEIAKQLKEYGYREVNLNLGCPSGTVVAKKRGAGMLEDLRTLEQFLDCIYEKSPLPVSIKTRIGMEEEYEWEDLQKLYEKYPVTELIIHPRLQKDFYKKKVHLNIFEQALSIEKIPLCYNGDIYTREDFERINGQFPGVERIMLGRGIFKNPGLIGEIKGEPPVSVEVLRNFLEELLEGYRKLMSGEVPVLYRMKEIWAFLGEYFPEEEKSRKKIKKANTIAQYKAAVTEIFAGKAGEK